MPETVTNTTNNAASASAELTNSDKVGLATSSSGELALVPPELAIEVKDLKVRYRKIKRHSLSKAFKQLGKSRANYFEALKGVSFNIDKGSIVGLIGSNGSGKSTLLTAIAGIFSPDEGSIDLKGNSVSLLSIGVGFQKELSGRENIILSGMLLGFTKKQIEEKTEEIIDFAELGDFIDMPVKSYSSGMYSKLAFSITAILETDIMLIDEILSVGDAKFRKKSYAKMQELIAEAHRTVIIVSHSMATLANLCDSVIWLEKGEIRMIGKTKEVIAAYTEYMNK